MNPIRLAKLAWNDTQARFLFPGILLLSGAALALFPTTGGRMVCDRGMCVQEHTAAFGTVRDAIMYPSTDITDVRIERGDSGQMTRVVIDTKAGIQPLTTSYSLGQRANEYIATEALRFLATDINARFAVAASVSGPQAFFRPVAMALLMLGALLAGTMLHMIPMPFSRQRR